MISLKSLLLQEVSQSTDLTRHDRDIHRWKDYWFAMAHRLRQAIFIWHQEGVVSDEDYEDVTKQLDKLDEFFKSLLSQSNKLMGRGIGPEDFADEP